MQFIAFRLQAWASLVVVLALYPVLAWAVLRIAPRAQRDSLFAAVNVLGAYGLCAAALMTTYIGSVPALMRVVAVGFLGYLLFALLQYWLLYRASSQSEMWGAAALWFPILALIVVKYIPPVQNSFSGTLRKVEIQHFSAIFLGLSYLSFRVCHLVQEVRNEVVDMPSVSEYLSFLFFVPTLSLGPISPYSRYIESYRQPDREQTPIDRSLLRILVGLTKYLVLSTLLSQYTYSGLLLDGHPHHKIDLPIAIVSYTIYLYCNFSGFCDIVIGISGLLGIQVIENFDAPFGARNLQEFWNRWHISLSVWLRDMMFMPLSKTLVRRFGPKNANNCIAFSIVIVFVVIGVWHGVGINYALFGLWQGIGLAVVHYYSVFLKKKLGKQGFAAYRDNKIIYALGVVMTFTYFSLSGFLFANSWDDMHRIFRVLQ
jgi:D-alanyl-lipoteichoic acid acyltransferase DltB (MBOAT superfamily)